LCINLSHPKKQGDIESVSAKIIDNDILC
jgi:hypothetical protein